MIPVVHKNFKSTILNTEYADVERNFEIKEQFPWLIVFDTFETRQAFSQGSVIIIIHHHLVSNYLPRATSLLPNILGLILENIVGKERMKIICKN